MFSNISLPMGVGASSVHDFIYLL